MPGSFSKFDAILIALVYQGQIGPCVAPGAPLFSIYPMSKDDDRHKKLLRGKDKSYKTVLKWIKTRRDWQTKSVQIHEGTGFYTLKLKSKYSIECTLKYINCSLDYTALL